MEDWSAGQQPMRIAGVPTHDEVARPSIEGRDALRYALSEVTPYRKPVKKSRFHWPKWLTWKRTVALVIVDLILAHFAWDYVFKANPGAARGALLTAMSDASHHNWSGVYDSLCRSDRAQVSEPDLASAGDAAMMQLGLGLDHASISSVTPVTESLGPLVEPQAALITGELIPVTGAPSPYTIVVVHEIPGGWKLCMSAGHFSMMGYTNPIGSFAP